MRGHVKNENFISIGPIDSRRVQFWKSALEQKKYRHQLITYDQIFQQDFPKIIVPTTLRITSPGESFELKKKIFAAGDYPDAENLIFKKGLIYPSPHWYHGWCILLQRIQDFLNENPLIKPLNTPAAIQLAFHKLKCQQYLQQQNIAIPSILLEQVTDYDALMNFLQKRKIPQVFIKPYHGSSASGVMAFRQSKGKQVLYTTIRLKDKELYNHLQLQRYTSSKDIKTIINAMAPSGLMVEQWIRKKTFQEKSVDFRVLVINGKASFVVPRMSPHFITNLHLGNEKGNIGAVEENWGITLIQEVKTIAEKAIKAIDGLFYAGVDVAVSNKGKVYVLEVNAFGDMLLNIYKDTLSTYEYELMEWERRNS